MLKIAFVYDALYPYNIGGAERRYFELAQRLKERHEIHLVTFQYWDGPRHVERDGVFYHSVGMPVPLYGADGKRTVRESIEFAVRVAPWLARQQFDVIDCTANPFIPLYTTKLAARVSGTPVVATWHEFWGAHWQSYLESRRSVATIARRIEAGAAGLSNRAVAVSGFTAGLLKEHLPRGASLSIVENGIDVAAINAARVPEGGFDLLFAGRLIEDKRAEMLIETTRELLPAFPALTCGIIGTGPQHDNLQHMIDDYGVGAHVKLLGRVDTEALYGLMKASKLFVMPSIREGFGIAVLEAQAAGMVPIVVRSQHNASQYLVEDGATGVVTEPDAASIRDTVARLLSDERSRQSIAVRARESAARRDWDHISRRMEAVYHAALGIPATAGWEEPVMAATGGD